MGDNDDNTSTHSTDDIHDNENPDPTEVFENQQTHNTSARRESDTPTSLNETIINDLTSSNGFLTQLSAAKRMAKASAQLITDTNNRVLSNDWTNVEEHTRTR